MSTPSFIEDHISQIPALQFLQKIGYKYLSPSEAISERSGRSSNVLLEGVLRKQLALINKIRYRGQEYDYTDNSIYNAMLALKQLPVQQNFMLASQELYDLLTIGKSLEQTIEGDKKSFNLQYIDWATPENNTYHVTEEFKVGREGRTDHYIPDVVLFINGIPLVVMECKSPKIKEPVEKAIEQHLRNQQDDGIRGLYVYAQVLIAASVNEALFATAGTSKEFWEQWKERFENSAIEKTYEQQLVTIKNRKLSSSEKDQLYADRDEYERRYFEQLEKDDQQITAQDRLIYSLTEPKRLLDLIFNFCVYDDGEKKIARYQQYFGIHKTIRKISKLDKGKREGGVIWHTQGSGKSLSMVMLAQMIALRPDISNPRIVLVTDRVDLDDQITETFKKCGKEVVNATTGASAEIAKKLNGELLTDKELAKLEEDTSLVGLLVERSDAIVTTVINKFASAVNKVKAPFESPDIFVLIDEAHRSQYNTFNINMQKVFPNACFIAFTGTPLMKREKNTAGKFGGMIDTYSIVDAVEDKAVVRLIYEGRHNIIKVNENPLDTYFEKISEPLTKYGKAEMKRRFSKEGLIHQADQVIYARAWDICQHYQDNFQLNDEDKDLQLKGMVVTKDKLTAMKYKQAFDEIGRVSTDVVISPPDMREGEEDAYTKVDDKIKNFWNSMMDKYGSEKKYLKSIISAFKKREAPELLIVVDKLLTGFDVPRNGVLYITRNLKEHTLLQAIARVNRKFPGKEYGYIIDYYGLVEQLDQAITTYSSWEDFDAEDIKGALTNINKEIELLPQKHSEVWDVFKAIKNKYDEAAYEELLIDDAIRYDFYEKLSDFARILKLALASYDFVTNTQEKVMERYKRDAKFFLSLRVSVKRRYSDDIDYKEFEPQIQKLVDRHITTEGEVIRITKPVDIFDVEKRKEAIEEITGKAAQADHIASRTLRAINVRMDEDPVFYKKLSTLIKETIEAYHHKRISEAEFFNNAKDYEEQFLTGGRKGVPESVAERKTTTAFYHLVTNTNENKKLSQEALLCYNIDLAKGIENIMQQRIMMNTDKAIVDWQNNQDIVGKIKIDLDDLIFECKDKYDVDYSMKEIDKIIEEVIRIAKYNYN